MSFPLRCQLGPLSIYTHWLFESLAYFAGFRLYFWQHQRQDDVVNFEQ